MSQKKIIIWSLVIAIVINLWPLFDNFRLGSRCDSYGSESFYDKEGRLVQIEEPLDCASLGFKTFGWPLKWQNSVPYNEGVFSYILPIQFLNILFWSFIVWIVLTLISKIRNKKGAIAPQIN